MFYVGVFIGSHPAAIIHKIKNIVLGGLNYYKNILFYINNFAGFLP
jgi:hypothetical protein